MRKIIALFLGVTLALGGLAACGKKKPTSSSDGYSAQQPVEEYYRITFKQNGQEDVVKKLLKGETLTDVPTPKTRVGYDVGWNVTDFSQITEDTVVQAVETAKTYTVTFDAGAGTVSPTSQTVVYDSKPSAFPVPTREEYDFVCWTYNGITVLDKSPWSIADDVTLLALWRMKDGVIITFMQDGCAPINKVLMRGETLTDIPTPQQKTGYDVAWDVTDFSNITTHMTVMAMETPKQYTVSFDTAGGDALTALSVIYDSDYALPTPTRVGYEFKGWKRGASNIALSGKWKIDEEVTLTAEWQGKLCTITFDEGEGNLAYEGTMTVRYGDDYELPKATWPNDDKSFRRWKYNGEKVELTGKWSIDAESVTLEAHYSSNWTGFF